MNRFFGTALALVMLTYCCAHCSAGFVVHDLNQNGGLSGFNSIAGSSIQVIDFDGLPSNFDLSEKSLKGIRFDKNSERLLVVDGSSTFTPPGVFSPVTDINTNKLWATSGSKVLSPGGAELGLAAQNDGLILTFEAPVNAFGFDVLWQSADGGSGTTIQVFDQNNLLGYSGSIPSTNLSGGGSPGAADFWGVTATDGTLIGSIKVSEFDSNTRFPDANIGFDTLRFSAVPEPATSHLITVAILLQSFLRRRRVVSDLAI